MRVLFGGAAACEVTKAVLSSPPLPSLSAPRRQSPLSYGMTEREVRRSIYHPRTECSAGLVVVAHKKGSFLPLPHCSAHGSVSLVPLVPPKWDGFGALSPEEKDRITCPDLTVPTFNM